MWVSTVATIFHVCGRGGSLITRPSHFFFKACKENWSIWWCYDHIISTNPHQIDQAFPIFLLVCWKMWEDLGTRLGEGERGEIGCRNPRVPIIINLGLHPLCIQSWLPTFPEFVGLSCKLEYTYCPTVPETSPKMCRNSRHVLYNSIMLEKVEILCHCINWSLLLSDIDLQTTPIIFISGNLFPNKVWLWLPYYGLASIC